MRSLLKKKIGVVRVTKMKRKLFLILLPPLPPFFPCPCSHRWAFIDVIINRFLSRLEVSFSIPKGAFKRLRLSRIIQPFSISLKMIYPTPWEPLLILSIDKIPLRKNQQNIRKKERKKKTPPMDLQDFNQLLSQKNLKFSKIQRFIYNK